MRAHVLHPGGAEVVDAAPSPIASAIAFVPASNFQGSSFQVECSRSTREIMWPPPRKGRISLSSSRRPCSSPTVGPSALWPVQA